MADFVDHAVIHATAGSGGHGAASVHREKFKPLGGPNGGNGGRGGSVILVVDPDETTLLSFHWQPHRKAENGRPGEGGNRAGASAEDLLLPVPEGTVVRDTDGTILADLVGAGTQFVVAEGGRGGLGNAALASPRRKAPGFALLGEPGEERTVHLELKTIADVALVGFPSAGKSSLIAAISAAKPKIADYPFTTLVPNLGVVQAGDYRYTVADVPGLIPGASQGRGLGHEFLRHVERTHVLVHVIDCATFESDRDPISDLETIEGELSAYDEQFADEMHAPLGERPRIVVLNKIDVPDAKDMADFVEGDLRERGYDVYQVSAAAHFGLPELKFALGELVQKARAALPQVEAERVVIRPRAADQEDFTITEQMSHEGPFFQVLGRKPERWVSQTNFDNDEAVGFLADRLSRLGIEKRLVQMGAVAGDTVVIGPREGGMVFDWDPSIASGAEVMGAARGSDHRLDVSHRPTRAEKRRDRLAEYLDEDDDL